VPVISSQGRVDCLFSSAVTPLTVANLNNGDCVGPGGVGAASSAGLYDLRSYRSVFVYLYLGSLTGGTTPTGGIQMVGFDAETYPGAGYWSSQCSPVSLTASGGNVKIIAGEAGMPIVGSGGESQNGVVGYFPLFMQLTFKSTGTPTGVSAPGIRLFVYARR
jgi:hypothetical protein